MMNPTYHFARMHELIDEFQPSRERSLALTKLKECEMLLRQCKPTEEARGRDQSASAPGTTFNVFKPQTTTIRIFHNRAICGGPGICLTCST